MRFLKKNYNYYYYYCYYYYYYYYYYKNMLQAKQELALMESLGSVLWWITFRKRRSPISCGTSWERKINLPSLRRFSSLCASKRCPVIAESWLVLGNALMKVLGCITNDNLHHKDQHNTDVILGLISDCRVPVQSFIRVGVLQRTRFITMVAILIQWDANGWVSCFAIFRLKIFLQFFAHKNWL